MLQLRHHHSPLTCPQPRRFLGSYTLDLSSPFDEAIASELYDMAVIKRERMDVACGASANSCGGAVKVESRRGRDGAGAVEAAPAGGVPRPPIEM